MAFGTTIPFERRTAAITLAIASCSVLAILPMVGLWKIDRATNESHDFTQIVRRTDELSNTLLQLVTGPLAAYGSTRDPAARDSAVLALDSAKATMAGLDTFAEPAAELEIDEALNSHVANAKQVIATSEVFLGEIDEGKSVQDAASTAAVLAAAGNLLQGQGQFTIAVGPTSEAIDEHRRSALRTAQALLFSAVGVAVLALGALVVVDNRRVRGVFRVEQVRREDAERLAQHRADVVSMASHELRNPLTIMTLASGALSKAAKDRNDSEFVELSEATHTAARRCELLVDQLLDLGRLDADRLQLKVGATPLLSALREAIEVAAGQHGERSVTLIGDEATSVQADAARLRIIVRNLVDNAFKYSPEGSRIEIEIAQWGDLVRLEVRDQGKGVPEESRERIFERFERVTDSEQIAGVGIGLFLSRELARRMEGDLRCLGGDKGGRFQLELPHAMV